MSIGIGGYTTGTGCYALDLNMKGTLPCDIFDPRISQQPLYYTLPARVVTHDPYGSINSGIYQDVHNQSHTQYRGMETRTRYQVDFASTAMCSVPFYPSIMTNPHATMQPQENIWLTQTVKDAKKLFI